MTPPASGHAQHSARLGFQQAPAPSGKRPQTAGGHLFVPRRWHRPAVLKWLRRTHAWLGVWGAVMGLLFGLTGFFLNHRATMKVPGTSYAKTQWQLELPSPPPATVDELAAYLKQSMALNREPHRKKVEPAGPAPWPGATQPEHWQIAFNTPRAVVNAEYWVGNRSVSVERTDPNFLGKLVRLHTGAGASVAWILLTDTLAGALIALSLTGFLLWTKLHGPRLLALGLAGTCLALLLVLGITSW